ncbi:MAG: hypothetical protein QOE69_3138 [Thermoleophilaceae bacterium]|nr:hypothetical protein [Thermoleophilaceae bacterium]MEA2409019.1 hypothetical protein [Thermoleophilaceae bacterium]
MAARSDGAPERRAWWRDISTAVGVAGLLLALIFNTIGVWRSEREARKSRVASEVSLLTQVGNGANQAARALTESGANDKRCLKAAGLALNDSEEARLADALNYYDYLAWLFNHDQITLQSAKDYWGPDMLDVYELGKKFTGSYVDVAYAELARFNRTAHVARQPDACGG